MFFSNTLYNMLFSIYRKSWWFRIKGKTTLRSEMREEGSWERTTGQCDSDLLCSCQSNHSVWELARVRVLIYHAAGTSDTRQSTGVSECRAVVSKWTKILYLYVSHSAVSFSIFLKVYVPVFDTHIHTHTHLQWVIGQSWSGHESMSSLFTQFSERNFLSCVNIWTQKNKKKDVLWRETTVNQ